MYRVCFHFEVFDRDVSGGTVHALHQWHELCVNFEVTEVAIINLAKAPVAAVNDSLPVTEYETLDDFLTANPFHYFVEQDGRNHRDVIVPDGAWLVFGPANGLPRSDLSIPVRGALYPREAAAIILENQWAQSRS